jgi:hypothetical protein
MRHSLVTVRMLEQAQAALDDEAASRPVPQPRPQPQTRPATGRLAMTARTLARRARALTARAT